MGAYQIAVLTKVKMALTLELDKGVSPATYREQAAIGTRRLGQCPVVDPAIRFRPLCAALLFGPVFCCGDNSEVNSRIPTDLLARPSLRNALKFAAGTVLSWLLRIRVEGMYPFAGEVPFCSPCTQLASAIG